MSRVLAAAGLTTCLFGAKKPPQTVKGEHDHDDQEARDNQAGKGCESKLCTGTTKAVRRQTSRPRRGPPPPLPVTISLARLALLSTDKAQCFQTVWQQMLHSSRCFRSNPGEPGKPTTPQPKPKSKNSSCPTSSSFPTFIGTSSRKTPKQEPEPSACTPRTLHEVESFNFLIETSRAKNRDLSTCDPGL